MNRPDPRDTELPLTVGDYAGEIASDLWNCAEVPPWPPDVFAIAASDSTVMALAGHVSRAMMERYSHIGMKAKRRAVDDLSGTEFEPGWAQNRAQFFLTEKPDEANSLKKRW